MPITGDDSSGQGVPFSGLAGVCVCACVRARERICACMPAHVCGISGLSLLQSGVHIWPYPLLPCVSGTILTLGPFKFKA